MFSFRSLTIAAIVAAAGAHAGCGPGVPVSASVSGVVRDLGAQQYGGDGNAAGGPIRGATVVIGPALIAGATPPPVLPAGDARATTAADGSFTVRRFAPGATLYVMVFPSAGDEHISLHAIANVTRERVRPLFLYRPSTAERVELALINDDRASDGAPPLIPDEIAFETARASTAFKAKNGYYQHCIPASRCTVLAIFPTNAPPTYGLQYASPNDLYNALGGALRQTPGQNDTENYYVGLPAADLTIASWPVAQAAFMAEKCNLERSCRGGPVNGGVTSHYLNIVNRMHRWVGLGSHSDGIRVPVGGRPTPSTVRFGVYVQEFY
jgi:hypothetical protein